MKRIKLDLSGKDAIFLSNCHRYLNGIANLEMFKNPPPHMTLERITAGVNLFQMKFESSANYDRVEIVLRKAARKELTEMFKQVLHYVQSVMTEELVPSLLQAGFELCGSCGGRKKPAVTAPTA